MAEPSAKNWVGKGAQSPEPYLLVVEDSDEDFEVLTRILAKNCKASTPMKRCCDGDEALDFLYRKEDYTDISLKRLPSVILLDLNLPGTDGREVLAQLKQDEHLKVIPIVVFTTSSNPKDVDTCYRYGVNSYLLKQMDLKPLKQSVCLFMDYWLKTAVLPDTTLKNLKKV
ncbi:MAG: response regulator [Phormidesmis sp.]